MYNEIIEINWQHNIRSEETEERPGQVDAKQELMIRKWRWR